MRHIIQGICVNERMYIKIFYFVTRLSNLWV